MSDYQLYHGDCLQKMHYIEDGSVDMILTDLPYGVLNKNNPSAKWDSVIPLDLLWEQYKRVIKPSGAILLFGQGMFTAELMISNKAWWRYNLIWDKVLTTGFLNAHKMPLRSHEDIVVFYDKLPTYNPQMTKGEPLHGRGTAYKNKVNTNNNYGDFTPNDDTRKGSTEKFPKSILTFPKPHPSVSVHPTEKPVELLEYLIKTYTNEGERVLDSCMGSGSTGVACIRTNRYFIGIEKDDKYFEIAKNRIEKEMGRKPIPNIFENE